MIDRDVAGWLLELLGKVQLSAADPDLVQSAAMVARVREQLTAVVSAEG